MSLASFPCDLHTHTVRSDGNDTPVELVANAKARGVRVLVLCDHDVVPPQTVEVDGRSVDFRDYALKQGVVVLPGIEFSCQTEIEDCHIVTLGCDFDDPDILQICDEVEKSKSESYVELLRRLGERGMPITLEEVLDGAPLEELQKKRIFDRMARKGYAPDWKTAKLMVRDDPYLSVKRRKPDALRVIQLARRLGGITILAHPFLIDPEIPFEGETVTRAQFIDRLIDAGLCGIESCYPYAKTSTKDPRPSEELWALVRQDYTGRLFISGGSDYHDDAKKGTANPRELGECGLTMEAFLATPLTGLLTPAQRQALGI